MDAKEKLVALQKAYADIILNISKEAAARVMSSERRAVQYQHELKMAKEEALRMLLRIKQMMDAKTSEVGTAVLNQQKKIEELEAQLQEAEDIVKDLREELGEVQVELERLKKNNLQNVNQSNSDGSSKFLHPNSGDEYAVASERTMPNPSQQNECFKCYHAKKDCMCIRNKDFPSIISRGNYKEPGLYRNGCTQRIRACERNLLDKNSNEEQEEGVFASKAPFFGDKARSELENKLLADMKLSSFQPFRRKRKRATKQRETSTRHVYVSDNDNAHSTENPSTIAPVRSADEDEKLIHRGHEESSDGRVLQKDEGLKDNETKFDESLSPLVCKEDDEKDDVASNSLDRSLSETTKGLPREPVRERIIKYTFQRKRKRGTPSGCEVKVWPEMEKRNGEKKSVHKNHEPSKVSLSAESSRDSRRLAQVARQLISLSEKKWWN